MLSIPSVPTAPTALWSSIIEHLLGAIAGLARQTRRAEDRRVLLREAELAADCAHTSLSTEDERRRVEAGLDEVRNALKSEANGVQE